MKTSEKSRVVNSQGPYRPLTCDNTVPEVGLQRDSRACHCWEVAEHAESSLVRGCTGSRRRKVWTMSKLSRMSIPQWSSGRTLEVKISRLFGLVCRFAVRRHAARAGTCHE